MRVAILNRPPGPGQGGDAIAIRYTIDALARTGFCAQHIWGSDVARRLRNYDLAHVYHVNFHFCRDNFSAVKAAGIPYVVTPIYYAEFEEMTHVEQAEALDGAHAILPFSVREGEELREQFGIEYIPIPNGTDPTFHANYSSGRFGVCVSDWCGSKNPQVIGAACAELGVPFRWIKDAPHDKMPAEYRRYRVFASASRSDRMSLAVGEALCSGCRVLASEANRGNEWYPGLYTMPPDATVEMWAAAIADAHGTPEWDWRPNEAARRMTWDSHAAALKAVYERALNA